MASVNVQEEVAASADQVWQLMGDFGGLVKWADPNLVKSCECDGNSPGVIRTLTLADGSVRFVSESVDTQVFLSACTRAGGEVQGEW